MATIVKFSTKRGKELYNMGRRWIGETIDEVYGKASPSKYAAFNQCAYKCNMTPDSSLFHICSKNTFSFTVAWVGTAINPDTGEAHSAMFIETYRNSYIVLLDC